MCLGPSLFPIFPLISVCPLASSLGTMDVLPLAGFTHSHRSLAWSLTVVMSPVHQGTRNHHYCLYMRPHCSAHSDKLAAASCIRYEHNDCTNFAFCCASCSPAHRPSICFRLAPHTVTSYLQYPASVANAIVAPILCSDTPAVHQFTSPLITLNDHSSAF